MSTRSELIDALCELRAQYPDWRFGQLVSNVAGWADQEVWDVDDQQLLAAVKEHLATLARRKEEARI